MTSLWRFYITVIIFCSLGKTLGMFGGIVVDSDDKYPFLVHININLNGNRSICAGVLIDSSEVLTAAHCFRLPGRIETGTLLPAAGAHALPDGMTASVWAGSRGPAGDVDMRQVSTISIRPLHPPFISPHDLVSAHLESDFKESYRIRVLPIDQSLRWNDSCWETCITVGWGHYDGEIPRSESSMQFGGHEYKHFHEPVNWTTAKLRCETEGAYLADVRTEEENHFLATNRVNSYQSSIGTWIGLKRDTTDGSWGFVHEDVSSKITVDDYHGFASSQPNDDNGDCGSMYYGFLPAIEFGKWINGHCDDQNRYDFWCEKEYPGSTSSQYSLLARELKVSLLKKEAQPLPKQIWARAVDDKYYAYPPSHKYRKNYRGPLKGDAGAPLLCKMRREGTNVINPPWHFLGVLQHEASRTPEKISLFFFSEIAEMKYE